MSDLESHIAKRRTFAIISHPDAGKTTLTETLLLLGGAINMAGTVKAKKSKLHARSDWMEIEKKRGISVTSSVLKFTHQEHEINLIDTPGHQDFSEDTYRTLTAVDSVLMLIDAASGVEAQTKKLFEVCRLQQTPTIAFINKMDRHGRDPFELMDEITQVLGIACCPLTWPTGSGQDFMGVYDRQLEQLIFTGPTINALPSEIQTKLDEELELLREAGDAFDASRYLQGQIAPVLFGSAITGFGVKTVLDTILRLAPPPGPRTATQRRVEPGEPTFSAFIFKIQANMDPAHRDRVAFMRICSGIYTRNMKVYVVRLGQELRLSRPTKFVAKDRSFVEKAYPGDIVGIHDPGVFAIGDTLSQGEILNFQGISVFAPEHFAAVHLQNPLKSKQLTKGLRQLSEEGAVQIFYQHHDRRVLVGVVGMLQFDVVKFRLQAEYNLAITWQQLPYSAARWITTTADAHTEQRNPLQHFIQDHTQHIFHDRHQRPVVFIDNTWKLDLWQTRYPDIIFHQSAGLTAGA